MIPIPTSAPDLGITCFPREEETLLAKARSLANSLGVPLYTGAGGLPPFLLIQQAKGLGLYWRQADSGQHHEALFVDFVHGSAGYRREHGGGIRQPLARAAGLKGGVRPRIVDATAGLGVDSFILAALGCEVTMLERSPIMGALLADGLERAAAHPATSAITERLQLHIGNACDLLATLTPPPDTIYLDPMYPHRRGSALNRLEMRAIRSLVGDDEDAGGLLAAALRLAAKRVTAKRPKGAPLLGDNTPSHTIDMKNSRFDVYLTGSCR